MKLVIDTSVAVKWFLVEAEHETALALLETRAAFHAPDLIFTEFATAMQKKIRLGEIDRAQATASCASLPDLFVRITPTLLLFERALEIAVEIAHPVQDCVFLACAERDGLRAVTADRKLVQRASEGRFGHLITGLRDAVDAIDGADAAIALTGNQLRDLQRLSARFTATLDDLGERGQPSGTGFSFLPAAVYGPAFAAPAFLRLRELVRSLSRDQLCDLTALCWLGRGYDGTNWSRLRGLADTAIDGHAKDSAYVLSLLSYLSAGIERARSTSSATDDI